jgi:DNA-binding beta-propeller fold protein YncE
MHPSGDRYFVTGEDVAAAMSPTGDTALAIVTIPYMGYEDGCPLGMSPDGSYLYVAGYFYPWLWRIRASDMVVTDSVQIGQLTRGIAVSPDGQHVYVVNAYGSLQVLRTSDLTVEHTTQLGSELSCIIVNPSGQYVYVGCYGRQELYVVRTSDYAVGSTLPIATRGMCVRPDGAYLYVGSDCEATIVVVRTSDHSIAATIALPDDAQRLAVTPDGGYVYFTGSDNCGALRTSDNLVRGYIPTGLGSLAFTPDGQTAYGVGSTTAIVLTR